MSGATFARLTGTKPPVSEEALKADRPYHIALVVKNRVNPAYISAMMAGSTAAARYGIEIVNCVPVDQDDLDQQSALLTGVIDAGTYDGVIITPVDAVKQAPLIERANQAGLPVYNISNLMAGGEIVSFVGSDDVAIGRQVIEWLAGVTKGSARLGVITGSSTAPTARDRAQGVTEALARHPGLVCVAEEPANYNRGLAKDVAARILASHADIEWLVALNDDMALGAIEAVQQAGRIGSVRVTGVNGIPEGLLAVRDGRLAITVDYALYTIAMASVELAVRHLNGERIEAQTVLLPTKLIDASNVDEVIEQRRTWGMM
jgi:ribose transport system substrate-binding protein